MEPVDSNGGAEKRPKLKRRSEFEQQLAARWPPGDWQDVTIFVAVSGGADSVALLRGLRNLKSGGEGRIVAAHFNHRLRGAESDADEAFVVELCRKIGIACEVGRAEPNVLTDTAEDGVEAAARDARYDFLLATAERLGARFIATAHTADDQAETILHRILRGTGLAGLAGIPRVRALGPAVTLIRPMLELQRGEVVEYLRALGQDFRTDATNFDTRFTRNRIRHDLLPQLAREYNPQVADALLRLGSLAAEAQQVVASRVAPLRECCVRLQTNDCLEIDCPTLAAAPRGLVRELFVIVWDEQRWPARDMTFEKWDEVATLAATLTDEKSVAASRPVVRSLPGDIRAERCGDRLILSRPNRDLS